MVSLLSGTLRCICSSWARITAAMHARYSLRERKDFVRPWPLSIGTAPATVTLLGQAHATSAAVSGFGDEANCEKVIASGPWRWACCCPSILDVAKVSHELRAHAAPESTRSMDRKVERIATYSFEFGEAVANLLHIPIVWSIDLQTPHIFSDRACRRTCVQPQAHPR